MNRAIRTLVLAVVSAVALSSAGTALAAYTTPKLLVTDAGTSVTIKYSQSAGDDAPARVTVYVPTGYAASLSQPAGSSVGTVAAQGTAADLGGALLPLTGTIQARAATGTYLSSGAQRPLATAATECTGSATHTAFWVLVLQAAGQTLEVPAYVDEATAPTSAFAKATIQFCLPPPDLPAGHPSRAAFGFKLTQSDLKLNDVFTNSGNGSFRWRAIGTPYRPLVGQANAAATVEIQSLVAYPRSATLRRPAVSVKSAVATVRVAGTLALPQGESGTVRIFRGSRAVATPRVSGSSFTASLRVKQTNKRQVFTLQARATVPGADLGSAGCQATFGALGVPCIAATRAGYTVRSAAVRVTIPARKR